MFDEELTQALLAASAVASNWREIAAALRETAGDAVDDQLRWLVWAFEYALEVWPVDSSGILTPVFGYNDGTSYPPRPEDVPESALVFWAEMANVDGPVVGARLHDLLWQRRQGEQPHLHARAAASAYLELAKGNWERVHRTGCLVRALQLARSLNDSVLMSEVCTEAVAFVADCLVEADPRPGPPLRALRALVDLPVEQRPCELDALLEKTERLFGDDSSLFESVQQMKMAQANSDDERTRLQVAVVDRWLAVAASDTGLGRHAHLRHALELAEGYGLSDSAREVRRRMQDSPAAIDDFREVAIELPFPRAELEQWLDRLVGEDGWQAALTRMGAMAPPSGDHEANLAQVERSKADHPFLFLIPKVIFGPHGFPVQHVSDERLKERVALSEQEQFGMEFHGVLISMALNRIRADYGVPSSEELTSFFTAPFIPSSEVAERIAASLEHYWQGRLDECVHVLCPRIEATLRTALMKAGMTVISPPRGERPEGVRALGELLLEAFKRDIFRNRSQTRYLHNLLCDPYGMNLRNAIAHGFLTKARLEEAALLIQSVCYLRLLDIAPVDSA